MQKSPVKGVESYPEALITWTWKMACDAHQTAPRVLEHGALGSTPSSPPEDSPTSVVAFTVIRNYHLMLSKYLQLPSL